MCVFFFFLWRVRGGARFFFFGRGRRDTIVAVRSKHLVEMSNFLFFVFSKRAWLIAISDLLGWLETIVFNTQPCPMFLIVTHKFPRHAAWSYFIFN